MSFVTAIGTANPAHALQQDVVAAFMVRAMQLGADDARKLRVLFRASGIDTRYSVVEDYGKSDDYHFFENSPGMEPFPTTRRRLELYSRHALALSLEAIQNCMRQAPQLRKETITHLIVVSCTGMYAPGLDIDLVKALGLNASVERTCVNFMGCYAAFNALKMAAAACMVNPQSRVLIVCTELCSIHFQKENTEDNMLANALFGDGSAAVLVEAKPRSGINYKLEQFHCELATEGEHDMTWTVGDLGFEMRLSSYVPEVIRAGVRSLTRSLLSKTNIEPSAISFYAIHPGGKKILETIESELGVTRMQNRFAYEILRDFGNMSSATVLFVIAAHSKELSSADHGKRMLSIAFGPGLTLESMVVQINYSA